MNKEEIKEIPEKLEYKDLLAENIKEKDTKVTRKTDKKEEKIIIEVAFSDEFNFAIRKRLESEEKGMVISIVPTEGQINYLNEKKGTIIPCTKEIINTFLIGHSNFTNCINEDEKCFGLNLKDEDYLYNFLSFIKNNFSLFEKTIKEKKEDFAYIKQIMKYTNVENNGSYYVSRFLSDIIESVNKQIPNSSRFKELLLNLYKSLNEAGFKFNITDVCNFSIINRFAYSRTDSFELENFDNLLPEKIMPIETLVKALKIIESYLVNNWLDCTEKNQMINLNKMMHYRSSLKELTNFTDNILAYNNYVITRKDTENTFAINMQGLIHSFFVFPENTTPENLALFYLKGKYSSISAQQRFFSSSKIFMYDYNKTFSLFYNIINLKNKKEIEEEDKKNKVDLNDHIRSMILEDAISYIKDDKDIPVRYYINNILISKIDYKVKYPIYLLVVEDELCKKENASKNFVVYANNEIIYTSRKLNAKDRKTILSYKY